MKKQISMAEIVDQLSKNKNLDEPDFIEEGRLKNPEGAEEIVETNIEDTDDFESQPEIPEAEDLGKDSEKIKKVLENTSDKLESLIDNLMEINTDKEYSKLIKLIQSAARLSDELLESEDLLD